MNRLCFKSGLFVVAISCLAGVALAQPYPSKPLRFVVPFPPGGINDVMARALGQKLTESLGQPVVIENRAGAGTIIGTELVAKSAPDGYTLLLASAAHAINVTLHRKLPFDPVKDFALVTLIGTSPFFLVGHPSLPARDLKSLVAFARSRPGQLQYSSSGSGTSIHLMGEMLKAGAKLDIVHVPYKGIAPALIDLIAGQVHFSFGSWLTTGPHVRAGKLRIYAATSPQRSKSVPDVPTIAEVAIPGYSAVAWYGIIVPAATAREIVTRLHGELTRALNAPDLNERLTSQGVEVTASTPAQFADFLKSEIERWGTAVRQSGAKPD
ncbi:MAG: tripartite tricarboxylate transporter substrate binding protein [Betaproteobacteria bacterium]|nr:MAG: tripartite tricarboxylate transporter substrate binding protein [Betaproteobacteria bacterium]